MISNGLKLHLNLILRRKSFQNNTHMENKLLYTAPEVEVLEVKPAAVICGSLTAPDDYNNGEDPFEF